MNRTCCFTIATPSHVPQACVLAESILASLGNEVKSRSGSTECRQPSDEDITVAIIMVGAQKRIPHHPENVVLYYVEDLIDRSAIDVITSDYTPAESCWALKPVMMEWLQDTYRTLYYFDSDVFFHGSISSLESEMGEAEILLTPHYLTPYPDDGCAPNDLTLLRGGVFNAGFIGVRTTRNTRNFLSWWREKVVAFGRNDPDNGMCGDQKWLDLVPVLFLGVKISCHPGFNVAYWNLHERFLSWSGDRFHCTGKELVFFHFSGFNQSTASVLSKHQNRIGMEGAVARLFGCYVAALSDVTEKFAGLDRNYRYSQWWHSHVRWYRFFKDLFRNPRKRTAHE